MADPTTVWDGDDLVWDGTTLLWDPPPPPAPDYPADLLGTFAPQLLTYSPHYDRSTFMRAVLQAYGYEFDAVLAHVETFDSLWSIEDCPDWALEWWEGAYQLSPGSDWSPSERRTALLAARAGVRTQGAFQDYVAAFARIDPTDVDIDVDGYELTVTIPGTVVDDDYQQALSAAQRATPLHMTLVLASA